MKKVRGQEVGCLSMQQRIEVEHFCLGGLHYDESLITLECPCLKQSMHKLFCFVPRTKETHSTEIYRVSQEERTKLRDGVPYVKLYRYNPKHLYPKLNGYGDNGKRSLKL